MPKQIEAVKIDDNTLGIIETVPEQVLPQKAYPYKDLKRKLESLQTEKARIDARFDAQIAEVEQFISEADKLGIVEKEK